MKCVALITPNYPSSQMRGETLRVLGFDVKSSFKQMRDERYDVAWLVKPIRVPHESILKRCDRLIFDPCDVSGATTPDAMKKQWEWWYSQLGFDAIVATSPAAANTMGELALSTDVTRYVVPHHADPLIPVDGSWHDAGGHIAYGGLAQFFKPLEWAFREAGKLMSPARELRVEYSGTQRSIDVLRGAALSLCVRSTKWQGRTDIASCKPQIKLTNAAAAKIPAVHDGTPAPASLYPDVMKLCRASLEDPVKLAGKLQEAIARPAPQFTFTLDEYLVAVREICDGRRQPYSHTV